MEVGPEWKPYELTASAGNAHDAATGRFGFTAGYQIQTVEIAQLSAVISN